MKISDILRAKGHTMHSVSPEDTVYNAIKLMSDKNIGGLLVLDDQDKLEGIITERDYRNKIILEGRSSKDTRVREIMTSKVYCVSPGQSAYECMAIMTNNRFRHCPVIQDDKLVGIVSIGDLVKAVIDEQEVEINDLREYITGSYPK